MLIFNNSNRVIVPSGLFKVITISLKYLLNCFNKNVLNIYKIMKKNFNLSKSAF